MLKAVIFDFDGTILDTESPEYQSWCELYESHGHTLDLATWCVGVGTRDGFDPYGHLESLLAAPIDREFTQTAVRARKRELEQAMVIRDGVETLLGEAQELGIGVAVASSSPLRWVTTNLERYSLRGHFHALVCAGEDLAAKPDPAVYLEALDRLNANPVEAVAFEDSPNGIAAAKAAGIHCIAVPNPITSLLDLSKADRVVTSLAGVSLKEVARAMM